MVYSELVKNFNRIRDYMREFYVYGFKSRDEFDRKSARSYDDERRRVESWLGDYMRFRQTPDGKNVFLSIDSRLSQHNPLYKAWKAKSFTDGDITLHFILFDILSSPEVCLSLGELTERIDAYLAEFDVPRVFDASTVRKKLREYAAEGLLVPEKRGKTVCYRRAETTEVGNTDCLDFFSEVAPCGVVGSYLLDKVGAHETHFAFKHHYITGALDSEILCALFAAMHEKRSVILETVHRGGGRVFEGVFVPLCVRISVQSGRQYLMAYSPRFRRITPVRTDNILSVKAGEVYARFDTLRERLNAMCPHIWGVSTDSRSGQRLEHVEFTVRYADDEQHILGRLEREKRCGTVERLDGNTARFSADVFDASEIVPWIRTFICRITEIHFSNPALEAQFKNDIEAMLRLYGLWEGSE